MGWACGAYGWGEGVYRVLVGKPEGKRPLGRPKRRWVDIQEVGCGYMDWIGLAQDRDRWWTLLSGVMNLRAPWNAGNFLTSCKLVIFSRRTLHRGVNKYIYGVHGQLLINLYAYGFLPTSFSLNNDIRNNWVRKSLSWGVTNVEVFRMYLLPKVNFSF